MPLEQQYITIIINRHPYFVTAFSEAISGASTLSMVLTFYHIKEAYNYHFIEKIYQK